MSDVFFILEIQIDNGGRIIREKQIPYSIAKL